MNYSFGQLSGCCHYYIEFAFNAKLTKEAPPGSYHLFGTNFFIFLRRIESFQPLVYHLFAPKTAKNHLKPLKVKSQNTAKHSHFRILAKITKRPSSFSIPLA